MLVKKLVMVLGIVLYLLLENGLGWLKITQVDAAPPEYPMALTTQTPTPKNAPNDGRPSPSVATSPAAHPGEFTTYKIQAGDNIFLIAQRIYGESSKYPLILAANNLSENSRLTPGTILKIPVVPTLTATFTVLPSPTATTTVLPAMPTVAPSPRPASAPANDPNVGPPEEKIAIMNMLTTFATSTLVGSTVLCLFLAWIVYSHARRVARQQRMARRIRPPIVR